MRQLKINTFSIVGYDPIEQAWGVAVASKFLAAAAVVSWARAGAGAVATQAFAKMSFGPDGLDLMQSGMSAEQALDNLLSQDPKAEHRQIGLIDAHGNVAAHTGKQCFMWAGHKIGQYYTCQGNILTGANTLDAMADAFETTSGPLAERLLAALLAGDTVGGDSRGKQSAGIVVVKANGSYGGDTDRMMDLRVDDDPEPVQRLAALVDMHRLFFGTPNPADLIDIDNTIATELQQILARTGHYHGSITGTWDASSKEAFWAFCGVENLEERWSPDNEPDKIDRATLAYIQERFSA